MLVTLPGVFLSIQIDGKVFRIKVNNRGVLFNRDYTMINKSISSRMSILYCIHYTERRLTGSIISSLHVGGRKFPLAAGNTPISCSRGLN